MNKQEVLYLPVKKEGFIFSTDDSECKRYYRTLDGEEVSSSFKAKSKEELLDQLKPVVPKFVAEWIETCKKKDFYLSTALTDDTNQTFYWLGNHENQNIFARAWLDGYEIEQEKLYTVRIPNPNNEYSMNVLIRLPSSGKIALVALHKPNTSYLKNKEYQLTEAEIKQDFDFLWQFAKEVEEK